MAKSIEQELREQVDAFVVDITAIVRQTTLETVYEALGARDRGSAARAPGTRRGPRSGATATRKKKAGRKAAKTGARKSSGRRTSEDIEQIADELLAHVRAHPGQRLEEISAEIGMPTAELKRPVLLLAGKGRIRTKGQKRGTRYFAARGGAAGKTARKKKKKTSRAKTGRKSGKKATRPGKMTAGSMASDAAVG